MSSVTESEDSVGSTRPDTCPWCCREVELLVVSGLGRVCPGCYFVSSEVREDTERGDSG